MAKQDLVVKLLLDSGAFGNDIREAERKAKDFSDKMKNTGQSMGEFSNALGVSNGALKSFGTLLAGGGAVITGVTAFKSIMESSYETSVKFKGSIEGCKTVVKEFQQALATMDFTNLNNLFSLWQNGKLASESMMHAAKSNTLFNWATSGYKKDLAAYKTEYNANGITPERKAELEILINELLEEWGKTAEGNYNNLFDTFIKNINKEQGLIGLTNTTVGREYAIEMLKEVARIITSDPAQKERDKKTWNSVKDKITKLQNEEESAKNTADRLEGLGLFDKRRQEAIDKREYARKELKNETEKNRDLMFRTTLYNLPVEEIQQILQNLETANQTLEEYHKQVDEVRGWIKGGETKQNTTPKVVKTETKAPKPVEPETKPLEGSLTALQQLIDENEKLKNSVVFGSSLWLEYNDNIKTYTEQLEELKFNQHLFNGELDSLDIDQAIDKLIELIDENNVLLGTLEAESEEYVVITGLLKSYVGVLGEAIEKQKELKEAKKHQEKIETMGDTISSLESVGGMVSSVSNLLSEFENETAQKMSKVASSFSSVAYGIMELISIKQAAAASEGVASAAAFPYPYNLAAIASVMATIVSVFGNIKQMVSGKYADGGIVGGTSYSGDKLFAMVNSGEMILNKRQQKNLSNMLGGGGGQVEFFISGDSLVGVLNNRENKRHLTR